jgi:probable rRNA maturation factor
MERKFSKIKKIKDDILGKDYSLSIAYVTEKKSRELNKKWRKKDKATNVLSFALSDTSGELILCKDVIKKEAKEKKFDKNFPDLLLFLVIHGMLHLKGMTHSSRMERAERKFCEKYDTKHFSGNRRGIVRDASRGRRVLKRRKNS